MWVRTGSWSCGYMYMCVRGYMTPPSPESGRPSVNLFRTFRQVRLDDGSRLRNHPPVRQTRT